jgi:hypothetical protein
VIRYSQSLGVAIAQTIYATNAGGETQALRHLLEAVELKGVLVQADALHGNHPFPLPRPARGRLPDRRQAQPPHGVSAEQRPAQLRPANSVAQQQTGSETGQGHHLDPAEDAGAGVGGGAVPGQRHAHRREKPWLLRGQADRRDLPGGC